MRATLAAAIVLIYIATIAILSGLKGIHSRGNTLDWLLTKSLGINTHLLDGPDIEHSGRSLIICNHPTYLDGFIISQWAIRKGVFPRIRFIVADWVSKIPLPGGFIEHHMIPIKRSWETDKKILADAIEQLPADAIVFIFPEGTTFCPDRLEKTVDYARAHHLPVYRNLLCPRVRGIEHILQSGHWDHIYDMTLHMPDRAANPFIGSDFSYILWGKYPRTCYVSWSKVAGPRTRAETGAWLHHMWRVKDHRLARTPKI
jgi:hypothetical protein